MLTETKHCQYCNKVIKGRSDKKFCNDYCRNYFNNKLNCANNNNIRTINNYLGKNRRILNEELLPKEQMNKIKKSKLLEKGFNFKFFTNTKKNKQGSIYYFCYDVGYFLLDEHWLVVIREE